MEGRSPHHITRFSPYTQGVGGSLPRPAPLETRSPQRRRRWPVSAAVRGCWRPLAAPCPPCVHVEQSGGRDVACCLSSGHIASSFPSREPHHLEPSVPQAEDHALRRGRSMHQTDHISRGVLLSGCAPRMGLRRLLTLWPPSGAVSHQQQQKSYHTADLSRAARRRRQERSVPTGMGRRLDGRRKRVGVRQDRQDDVSPPLPGLSERQTPYLILRDAGEVQVPGNRCSTRLWSRRSACS